MLRDDPLSLLFAACAEAAEEAVLNALCAGRELRGLRRHRCCGASPRSASRARDSRRAGSPLRSRDAHCGDRRSGRHGQGHDRRRRHERRRRARAPRSTATPTARDEIAAAHANVEVRAPRRDGADTARRPRRRRRGRQRRLAPAQPARHAGLPRGRGALHRSRRPLLLRDRAVRARRGVPARPGSPPRSRWARRRASRTCSRRRPSPSSRRSSRSRCSTPSSPGRPYDPDEPYVPAYAADTLIDEFTRPAPMFIDGREQLMPRRRRRADVPPARGRRGVRLHDPLRAGHPPPLLCRPRHPHVEWRLGLPPAHTLPLRALVAAGMASTDPVRRRRTRGASRATCSSPCSPARAARPRIPERSSACAPTSSARAAASASRSTPTCRSRSTPSGAPTPARTRPGVPPSVAAQLLASGQALRTGVGGPEVIIPVAPFFAALATRGMHAEISRAPPARLTHLAPRAAGILGAREKWPSG